MLNNQKLLYNLFRAYYEARKNKRNTLNQLDFEFNLEENLIKLYNELIDGSYKIGRSIYFIQKEPVKREIFAGDFRDRIVHHLVYNYISTIFEKEFIYDSYSCRKGKGTSFGVKRVEKFIRSCSDNYKENCYILKLDISGYFMSINKTILFEKIKNILINKRDLLQIDYDFILNLIKIIIFNDPTNAGIFKGNKSDYIGLPKNKSLFFAETNCGLPIGNLTSQLFSNMYLSDFDKFVKKELGIKYYGRYVDDFIIIHKDKKYLKEIILKINSYLKYNLGLNLHPKKIYLQDYTKGVLFLGVFIKQYRTYIRKRSIGYFYQKIQILNDRLEKQCHYLAGPDNLENYNQLSRSPCQARGGQIKQARGLQIGIDIKLKQDFLSIVNSYLGFLKHHKSYKKRKHLLDFQVNAFFWNYFYISSCYGKVVFKKN